MNYMELYKKAGITGDTAAMAVVPTPMCVVQRADPLDDASPIVKRYAPVMDGVCGFAWVIVKPGNSKFANWLKKTGIALSDSYYGGVSVWVNTFGQSMTRKEAYAQAFAKVLNENGIRAFAMSRMD